MKLFHRTVHSAAILANGFTERHGSFLAEEPHSGVWLSDIPIDANEGVVGHVVLIVEIPGEVVAPFEWINEIPALCPVITFREFLVPAATVNRFGPPTVHEWKEAGESE